MLTTGGQDAHAALAYGGWPSCSGAAMLRSVLPTADDLLKGAVGGQFQSGAANPYVPPGKFIFRPRTGRINWRLLHSLDLDRVIREGDVDTIQAYMDNLTFARFGREDLEVTSDDCIIKVVQLSQLCMEFLNSMCASSQHLLQGLAERVRVQAAQLKAAETSRRRGNSRRSGGRRSPSRETAMVASGRGHSVHGAARKCPHCPKRFQSEQYLHEHMLRRHAADLFGEKQVAHQPEVPDSSAPAASLGANGITEAVKSATAVLQEQLQQGLKLQLDSVQRNFDDALQAMRQDVGRVASDVGAVKDDLGKLHTPKATPAVPPVVVKPAEPATSSAAAAPKAAPPPPAPQSSTPSFDPEAMERRIDQRMSDLLKESQKMLLEKVGDVASAASKAVANSAKAASQAPSDDREEFMKQMRQMKEMQEQLAAKAQQAVEEVNNAAAKAAAAAVVSQSPPAAVPQASSVAAPPPPSKAASPPAPAPKACPPPQAVQSPAQPPSQSAKPPPLETSPPAPPQPAQASPKQATPSQPPAPASSISQAEAPQLPAPSNSSMAPAPPPEVSTEWEGFEVAGPMSPNFKKMWEEGLAKCKTDEERARFMVAMSGERTRPRKSSEASDNELRKTWSGNLSPDDAAKLQLEEPKVEQPDAPAQTKSSRSWFGGLRSSSKTPKEKPKPEEKKETVLMRRAFASGLAGFLQRCRPDLGTPGAAASAAAATTAAQVSAAAPGSLGALAAASTATFPPPGWQPTAAQAPATLPPPASTASFGSNAPLLAADGQAPVPASSAAPPPPVSTAAQATSPAAPAAPSASSSPLPAPSRAPPKGAAPPPAETKGAAPPPPAKGAPPPPAETKGAAPPPPAKGAPPPPPAKGAAPPPAPGKAAASSGPPLPPPAATAPGKASSVAPPAPPAGPGSSAAAPLGPAPLAPAGPAPPASSMAPAAPGPPPKAPSPPGPPASSPAPPPAPAVHQPGPSNSPGGGGGGGLFAPSLAPPPAPSSGGQAMMELAGKTLMEAGGSKRKDSWDSLESEDIQEFTPEAGGPGKLLNDSSESDIGRGSAAPSKSSPLPVPKTIAPAVGIGGGMDQSSISAASSDVQASVLIGGGGRAAQAQSPDADETNIVTPLTGTGVRAFSPPAGAGNSSFDEVKPIGDLSLASMDSIASAKGGAVGGWAGGGLGPPPGKPPAASPPATMRSMAPPPGEATPAGSTVKPFSPMSVSSVDSFHMGGPGPGNGPPPMSKSSAPVGNMQADDMCEESM